MFEEEKQIFSKHFLVLATKESMSSCRKVRLTWHGLWGEVKGAMRLLTIILLVFLVLLIFLTVHISVHLSVLQREKWVVEGFCRRVNPDKSTGRLTWRNCVAQTAPKSRNKVQPCSITVCILCTWEHRQLLMKQKTIEPSRVKFIHVSLKNISFKNSQGKLV